MRRAGSILAGKEPIAAPRHLLQYLDPSGSDGRHAVVRRPKPCNHDLNKRPVRSPAPTGFRGQVESIPG
jgi:hypothetical protein